MILLVPFLAVTMLFLLTPGPDLTLVTKNALRLGRKDALRTSLAIMIGVLVWTSASAVGVAALLEANPLAFTILKLGGAAYLAYLGIHTFISPRNHPQLQPRLPESRIARARVNSPYAQGFVNNLLNPKIAVLFTGLLPQFVTPGPSATLEFIELAGIFAAMGGCWLTAYSFLASKTRGLLQRPSTKKVLDGVTGTVLVAFGIKVAIETP